MGSKSSSSAPSADPMVGQAMMKQANVLEQQQNWFESDLYPWMQEQQKTTTAQNQQYMDMLGQNSTYWQNYATEQADRSNAIQDYLVDRYKNSYVPIENQLIEDATNYNTGAEAERQAALAIADQQTAYAAQRKALNQQMAQYGVDPSSGRYIGQQNALNIGQAAVRAAAANQARSAAQELGWTKKYQVAALGGNYLNATNNAANTAASTSQSAASTSTSALTSAAALNNQNYSNATSLANIGLQGYTSLSNGWGSVANSALGLSNYNLSAWNAQQQANQSSMNGIGSILGTGIGAYAALRRI